MPRTDRASRRVDAPLGRVFDAPVDREALEIWLPPGNMTGRFEYFDPTPGGWYRLVLTYTDAAASQGRSSADSDIVEVRFVDIVANERVVQAADFIADAPEFAGTLTLTWTVQDDAGGTLVEVVAADVPVGISAGSRRGTRLVPRQPRQVRGGVAAARRVGTRLAWTLTNAGRATRADAVSSPKVCAQLSDRHTELRMESGRSGRFGGERSRALKHCRLSRVGSGLDSLRCSSRIACIRRAGWLDQEKFGFLDRDRLMLNTDRHDEQLTRSQLDITVAESNRDAT